MSPTRYPTIHLHPAIASRAVLTLLTRSRSAPFMIMQKKMAALLPAESGM
jgi:hypothetical protein